MHTFFDLYSTTELALSS